MNEFSYFKQDIFPVLATIFSRTVVSQIRCRIIYTTGNKVKVCVWRLAAGDLEIPIISARYNFTTISRVHHQTSPWCFSIWQFPKWPLRCTNIA